MGDLQDVHETTHSFVMDVQLGIPRFTPQRPDLVNKTSEMGSTFEMYIIGIP